MTFPLATSSIEAIGLDPKPLGRLRELITAHIAEGRYPAAQIAVARHGKLGLVWTLGDARLEPQRVPARDETLWLLFSNTRSEEHTSELQSPCNLVCRLLLE